MNTESITSQPHEKIARLAHQLWELDGRQTGRDLEYWLKAEQQIGADGKPGKNATANPAPKNRTALSRTKATAI